MEMCIVRFVDGPSQCMTALDEENFGSFDLPASSRGMYGDDGNGFFIPYETGSFAYVSPTWGENKISSKVRK